MVFAQTNQGPHGSSTHESKVAGLVLNRRRSNGPDHTVKELRCSELQPRLALTTRTDGVDDVGALPPLLNHLKDDFRRVLQIGIQADYRVASRRVVPACQCRLVTKVPRQANPADASVRGTKCRNLPPGVVAAAVIN